MSDLMSHVVNRIDTKGAATGNKSTVRHNIIYLNYTYTHTNYTHAYP